MEYLNDFLEQEAGKMKEFLHQISTRTETAQPESILDWSGYIDQGKQLSILHSLLSEAVLKLPANRQYDLAGLTHILEEITKANATNNYNLENVSNVQNENIHQNNSQIRHQRMQERGIMRGVLTPSSLEKNIFRYNDPTVSSTPLIQHSHSTSSISSMANSSSTTTTTIPPSSYIQPRPYHGSAFTPTNNPMQPHFYNTNGRKSPPVNNNNNNGIRATTLPRNNHQTNGGISTVEIRANQEEINSNLIQIGLDPSNAFLRKSPTPLLKSTTCNGSMGMLSSGSGRLNQNGGSQLSLLSDRSATTTKTNNYKNNNNHLMVGDHRQLGVIGSNGGLNFSLGIPHCESSTMLSTASVTNQSNMPMNLEDLEDLIKYADEQNELNNQKGGGTGVKETLVAKGSNISIGVCSSGYQSIATQSQSSSPIEQGGGGRSNAVSNGKYQYLKYPSTSSSSSSGGPQQPPPPLAFKNPLYSVQQNNAHSSSLTPSSSEEHISPGDGYKHSRAPRTNPMVQYNKRNGMTATIIGGDELPIEPISYVSPPVSHHLLRYQRRLSLESARTLSDSSTDTENGVHANDSLSKRRKNVLAAGRSVEQCERQIERLQASVDSLRHKLEESDLRESNDDLLALPPHSDSKMRSIISR